MTQPSAVDSRHILHIVIFFLLNFGIGFLPPVGITPMGMNILGVFFGMLYGWTFIGFAWPSMICLVALGFTGYAEPGKIIGSAFSSPAVLFTMFVLAFTTYCDKSGINNVMAKWCLSRRVFAGHPWIFTASVLTGTLIIGFLVDGVPAAFLIAGILYSMFHDIDMKQGDDYPAYLLAGVYMAGVLSFACKPWAGQNLMGISALSDVSGGTAVINNITLIAIAMPVCIATLLLYTLIVRFIFRPDIARLSHLTPEYLDRISSQIRIDNKQRVAATALVVFLLVMFLPNILPAGSATANFFGKFNMVVAMVVILGVLSFLRRGRRTRVRLSRLRFRHQLERHLDAGRLHSRFLGPEQRRRRSEQSAHRHSQQLRGRRQHPHIPRRLHDLHQHHDAVHAQRHHRAHRGSPHLEPRPEHGHQSLRLHRTHASGGWRSLRHPGRFTVGVPFLRQRRMGGHAQSLQGRHLRLRGGHHLHALPRPAAGHGHRRTLTTSFHTRSTSWL